MDLHQHLPPHAHIIKTGPHFSAEWTTTSGYWDIGATPPYPGEPSKIQINGPNVKIQIGGTLDETQVIALLHLLGAINPAPEPLQPNESDWEKIISQIPEAVRAGIRDRNQDWVGDIAINIHKRPDKIEFLIYDQSGTWIRDPQFRPLDPDGPRDGLSATETPETHELDLRHSENSDSPTAP